MLRLGTEVVRDVAIASRREWLLADGLGGWASSTILGLNTRAGHGLLVTASSPPHPPLVLLSRVEEALLCDGERYELGTNDYGGVVHPRGYERADGFVLDPLPTLTWEVGGRRLSRSVGRLHGEPAVVLAYQYEGPDAATLEVRPLLAFREPHARQQENASARAEASRSGQDVIVQPYEGCPRLGLRLAGGTWEEDGIWYRGFRYAREAEDDAPAREDLFSPGQFRVVLRPGATVALVAWAGGIPPAVDPMARLAGERRRLRALGDAADGFLPDLRRAGDAFLVKAPGGGRAIASAYPGGALSAREALIALPGLCLATGRFEEARGQLLALTPQVDGARAEGRGGEAAEGDAFDAGLWWVVAVERFREATGDHEFIRARLQGALLSILEGYRAGTRRGIAVSPEGLLAHQDGATPMGAAAARGGAPRRGFAVEVQALWYSGLLVGADLARAAGQSARAGEWAALAARARESFLRAFWSESHGYLADVVDGGGADFSLRPHQLQTIALPHALLARDKAQRVLESVRRTLLCPVGLRSLPPTDPRYVGSAWPDGSSPALDRGAAFPGLAAVYFDALIRVFGEAAKAEAWRWIDAFAPRVAEGTLATVPEAFEGDEPHRPLGAVASARAVAEMLRLVTRLGRRPTRAARPDVRG
ncbi:MAG TPA: glycogen debranching enzyme N-terminal domain-containing protein [Vicinamibacteria bacterium]|nr:glycogen debranching enzyme N-terminal domain-containing protein [Vicinamibacteria bacterium]